MRGTKAAKPVGAPRATQRGSAATKGALSRATEHAEAPAESTEPDPRARGSATAVSRGSGRGHRPFSRIVRRTTRKTGGGRPFPTFAAFLFQAMGFVTGSRIAPLGGNHGWTRIHTDPVPWSFGLLCPWSSTSSGTIASGLNHEWTRRDTTGSGERVTEADSLGCSRLAFCRRRFVPSPDF